MKRLILSAVAALVAISAATSVLKSNSLFPFAKTGMPPVYAIQSADQTAKLPVQDFEDRSLVFPREPNR